MTVYFTKESKETIKSNYLKLIDNQTLILDVNSFLNDCNKYKSTIGFDYSINKELENRIIKSFYSKRFVKLIYIIDSINVEIINGFKEMLNEYQIFCQDLILIDIDQNYSDLYSHFDKII